MARKGILTGAATAGKSRGRAVDPPAPRGAVGALQSSLARMQESAVQDIDAGLIDDAGFEDRLGLDPAAQAQLVESLRTYGQQVPVLLRPGRAGRYEIVYGRRRLMALRELGLPVKAMIRQLDDHALVMAQGQENTSRQDLSFIEKASFAAQLNTAGYDRQTIAAALSVDMPMVSRLLKAGMAFSLAFLRRIGSAPTIGRDRWLALARALEAPGAMDRAVAYMDGPEFVTLASDDRFEAVWRRASQPKPKAKPKPRTLRGPGGMALGDIRTSRKGVTLNIAAGAGFSDWVNAQAETVLNELHARWQAARQEEEDNNQGGTSSPPT